MTASPDPLIAPRTPVPRMPDFFIVGHAKCGTTALYEMLRRHPQVFMPENKEPMFFARNPNPPAAAPGVRPFEQTGRYRETVEQYLSLFAPAAPEQRVGEASTFYLWSRAAPARIAAANPDARIIAILREPTSFVRSLHLQMLQNGTEDEKDLGRAIALEDARREGREVPPNAHWPEALMYSLRVRYVEQLRRYRELFGERQMLVLIYDDFLADNEATVRRVLRFLDVEEEIPDVGPVRSNPSVEVRSVRVVSLMRDVRGARNPIGRGTRLAVKKLTTFGMRKRLIYPVRRRLVYRTPQPVDERLTAELRSRFKPEVVALGEYLDRDLVTEWGYDRVE
jgi:hypothetical protein